MLKKRDMIRTAITMAGVGMSFALGVTLNPPTAAAQRQSFTIQAPDGGDCARLGGVWKGKTCTFGSHAIGQNQSWLIRRGATVIVQTQFVNFGNIGITDNASLELGIPGRGGGVFQNYGWLMLVPSSGFGSPGFTNHHFTIDNFNHILINKKGSVGGVFNNFGTIRNHKIIALRGFFHNSGPPVRAKKARIDNIGNGFFDNQNGRFENLGVITGRVKGDCPGDCFNRMAVTKSGKSTAKPGGKAAMSIGKQVAKKARPSVRPRGSRQRRRR
jgi:hypothetical protein